MTDPKHCGRCNHDCLGGQCAAGACQAKQLFTSSTFTFYTSIVLDSTYVYWNRTLPSGVEVLSRMLHDGSGATDLFAIEMGRNSRLATDSNFVYWKSADAKELRVCQLPDCAGGFRAAATNQPGAGDIVVDRTSRQIFWVNSGGGTTHLMSNPASPASIHTATTGIGALTTDGAYVYFMTSQESAIYKVPVGGGASPVSVANAGGWWLTAANATSLFFGGTHSEGGNAWPVINRVPVGTGGVPILVGYYPGGPGGLLQALIADEQYVYWQAQDYVGENSAHLLRCPVAGCGSAPTHLANVGGTGDGFGLAMTNAAVFWSVKQTIFKIAKE